MKILLVTPEYPPDFGGGIITFYRDLVPALRQHGCDVSVLKGSAYVHGGAPYEQDGVRVSVLSTAGFEAWNARFDHLSMFPELRRHLAAAFALHEQARAGDGFDAVEVTDFGLPFLPWAIESRARTLVQLHGSSGQIAHHEPVRGREAEGTLTLLLEKAALEAAPMLSTHSRANCRFWQELLGRPVEYIPPPMRFEREGIIADGASDAWLTIARIQRWKGPDVACAAWRLLGDRAPVLEWAGRDTTAGETGASTDLALLEQYPDVWHSSIRPIGQLGARDMIAHAARAQAVLVPSTWDVFNLAAAEAMRAGRPVIVSEGAGAADLIEPGRNGFVFPSGDAAALVDRVRALQALSDAERRALGEAAAETVRTRLDPAIVASAKIELYRQQPAARRPATWLLDSLLPRTSRTRHLFLDGLPLKELIAYVARRGLDKVLERPMARAIAPVLSRMGER
jgi:glycosyltransferase involved in cell wall biosynthesis